MLPFFVRGLLSSSLTLEAFIVFTEDFSPLLEVSSPFPGGSSSWLNVSKRFNRVSSLSLEVSLVLIAGFSRLWDWAVVGDSEAFVSAEGLHLTLSCWGLGSSGSSCGVITLSISKPVTTTYGLMQRHRVRCHATLYISELQVKTINS